MSGMKQETQKKVRHMFIYACFLLPGKLNLRYIILQDVFAILKID